MTTRPGHPDQQGDLLARLGRRLPLGIRAVRRNPARDLGIFGADSPTADDTRGRSADVEGFGRAGPTGDRSGSSRSAGTSASRLAMSEGRSPGGSPSGAASTPRKTATWPTSVNWADQLGLRPTFLDQLGEDLLEPLDERPTSSLVDRHGENLRGVGVLGVDDDLLLDRDPPELGSLAGVILDQPLDPLGGVDDVGDDHDPADVRPTEDAIDHPPVAPPGRPRRTPGEVGRDRRDQEWLRFGRDRVRGSRERGRRRDRDWVRIRNRSGIVGCDRMSAGGRGRLILGGEGGTSGGIMERLIEADEGEDQAGGDGREAREGEDDLRGSGDRPESGPSTVRGDPGPHGGGEVAGEARAVEGRHERHAPGRSSGADRPAGGSTRPTTRPAADRPGRVRRRGKRTGEIRRRGSWLTADSG